MPDIKLLGATYPDVPAVDLPTDDNDTARFYYATEGDDLEYGLIDDDSSLVGVGLVGYMEVG